eukprot:499732-Rhodomonas_salina.2
MALGARYGMRGTDSAYGATACPQGGCGPRQKTSTTPRPHRCAPHPPTPLLCAARYRPTPLLCSVRYPPMRGPVADKACPAPRSRRHFAATAQ